MIGAMLRALQQTTVLHYVFDPTAGVGAGLCLLSLYASSQWPATLLLGWAISKPIWKALRAAPPPRVIHVPINVVGVRVKT